MDKKEYALLMLDNMPLKGNFVIGEAIGYAESENRDDYIIYEDLITKSIIYPANYEKKEYVLKEKLQWISRKNINKSEVIKLLKEMDKCDILNYSFSIISSKEKKKTICEDELLRCNNIIKKIKHKKNKK